MVRYVVVKRLEILSNSFSFFSINKGLTPDLYVLSFLLPFKLPYYSATLALFYLMRTEAACVVRENVAQSLPEHSWACQYRAAVLAIGVPLDRLGAAGPWGRRWTETRRQMVRGSDRCRGRRGTSAGYGRVRQAGYLWSARDGPAVPAVN